MREGYMGEKYNLREVALQLGFTIHFDSLLCPCASLELLGLVCQASSLQVELCRVHAVSGSWAYLQEAKCNAEQYTREPELICELVDACSRARLEVVNFHIVCLTTS